MFSLFPELETAAPVAARNCAAKKAGARPAVVQDDLFADDLSAPAARRSFAEIVIANALARLDKPTDAAMKALFSEDIPGIAKAVPAEAFDGFIRQVAKGIHADYRSDFAWTIEAWGELATGSLRDVAVSLAHDPESSIAAWMNSRHWLNGDAALCAEFSTCAAAAKRRQFAAGISGTSTDHILSLRPECVEELAQDADKHVARTARFAALRAAGLAMIGELPRELISRMEAVVAKSAEHSMLHAEWNLEGRFIAGEAAIAADWQTANAYAVTILGIKADDSDELYAAFKAITGHTVKSPFGTSESRALARLIRNAAARGLCAIHAGELPEELRSRFEATHSAKFDADSLMARVTFPADATDEQKGDAIFAALSGTDFTPAESDEDESEDEDSEEDSEEYGE